MSARSAASPRVVVLIIVAVGLLGLTPARAADGAELFSRPAYPMGPVPSDAELADLDGDGVADLVSAVGTNAASWGVSVMRGRPEGGFDPHTMVLTEQRLEGVRVLDANGDGTRDVAALRAISEGDVNVSLLFGGESGLEEPRGTNLPIAAEVAFGRFTGGARPEAVLARDGALEAHQPATDTGYVLHAEIGPGRVRELLAVDLDGDGTDELVTADAASITLYRDLAPAETDTQPNVTSLSAADVTGDGRPEVLAVASSGWIKVLDADLAVVRQFQGPPSPGRATAADVDGDGAPEILVGSSSAAVRAYPAGGGSSSIPTANTVSEVWAADATGDGLVDLLAIEPAGSVLEVIEGDGAGGFAPQRAESFTAGGAWDLDQADFDGDGKMDVVAGEWDVFIGAPAAGHATHVMLGDGAGRFTRSAQLDTLGYSPSGTSAGDFNGDGNADVITSGYYGAAAQFLGNGDGTFLPGMPIASCMFSDGVTAGDFNADGYTDAAFICRGAVFRDHVQVAMGTPAGLVHGPQLGVSLTGQSYEMEVGDVNGDGNLDIAWASFDYYPTDVAGCGTDPNCAFGRAGRGVAYFLGLGNGLFEPVAHHYGVIETFVDLALEDLDGDGRDEFITPLTFLDEVQIANTLANGRIDASWRIPAYEYPLSIYAEDVTGDGAADLLMGHGPYSMSVTPGDGEGGFGPPLSFSSLRPVGEMAVADFDLDGDTDVIAGNISGLESFLRGS